MLIAKVLTDQTLFGHLVCPVTPPRGRRKANGLDLNAPRSGSTMTSWRLTRWLLFYLAMLLADAAVIVAMLDSA